MHLVNLYQKTREESGLYIGKKLKLEHIKLNSYSRMNVRLAAQVCICASTKRKIWLIHVQVLSKSVADSFKACRELEISCASQSIYSDTTETERFCRIFNRLFDCMNTRNLYESDQKRNDDLKPYTCKDDTRLGVFFTFVSHL